MKTHLKQYKIKIEAISPIFIGDGTLIKKKEYVYSDKDNKIYVMDIASLYKYLATRGYAKRFENYLLSNSKDLRYWLFENNVRENEYKKYSLYAVDTRDVTFKKNRRGMAQLTDIMSFTKDPYGLPYLPGSSIKGMLRTAILARKLEEYKTKYKSEVNGLYDFINNNGQNAGNNKNRKSFLAKETVRLENKVLNTRDRDKDISNAVNSIMSAILVSDSSPIDLENLTLCQKIDYSTDGSVNKLNIYRESIAPGTQIEFDLTLDESVLGFDLDYIMESIDYFNKISNQYFYKYFNRTNDGSRIVYIGGGVGLPSKILLYSIFKEKSAHTVQNIFKNTLSKDSYEKHRNDLSMGVSPHMCKCTYYKGKLYNMGIGKIKIV